MKSIILLPILFCTAYYLEGQDLSKRILITGNISVVTTTNTYSLHTGISEETTKISLSPSIAYMLTKSIGLGLSVKYSSTRFVASGSPRFQNTVYSNLRGPLMRLYPGSNLILESQILFGNSGERPGYQHRLREYNAGIGYAIFLGDHFALEPILGYRYNLKRYAPEDYYYESGLYFHFGLSAFISTRKNETD